MTHLLPTRSVTWRLKWRVTQKYQNEVVYQEAAAPVLMESRDFSYRHWRIH
ncbi:MAG: hypothetical protein ACXWEV_00835 [Methylobacter sp.]